MSVQEIYNWFCFHHSKPFIQTNEDTLSFNDILLQSNQFYKEISSLKQYRVGILCIPSVKLISLLYALMRLHTEIVLFSPKDPVNYVDSVLEQLEVDILFCNSDLLPIFKNISTPAYGIEKVNTTKISPPPKRKGQIKLADECIFIIMTSGSSSSPKKVVLTLENLITNAYYSNKNITFQEGDAWLLSLPLFHVSGLSILFRAIVGGGCIYLPDENFRWGITELPLKVTHISVVSTILKRMLDKKMLQKNHNLKCILLGGGPIPNSIVHECYQNGLPLYVTYGLTEMASQVTTTKKGDSLEHLLTCGTPLIPNTVRIEKDGTLAVRGPCRFLGYLEGQALEKPFDSEGWFNTQDIGEWTEDGYLRILGRKDSVFICGGENIQPEEIENHILSSGHVEKAVVVPLEDSEYGMIPLAFVEPSESFNEKILRDYLKEKISGIKIPRYFYTLPEELKQTGFKLSRKQLQNWAYEHLKNKE